MGVTGLAQLITAIRVDKLFGLYSYELPKAGSTLEAAAIFYGDNGVGKSTVLRLAFHLLSAGGAKGHRTALYRIPFAGLEVYLANDTVVSAVRDGKTPILKLEVRVRNKVVATWPYLPGRQHYSPDETFIVLEEDGTHRVVPTKKQLRASGTTNNEQAFLQALSQFAPKIFILNAERRLDSDEVPDPSDEIEIRRHLRYEEATHITDLVMRSREIALSQALGAAAKWISAKAVQGANQGSMNVHSVYSNVLLQLGGTGKLSSPKPAVDYQSLISRLRGIEKNTSEFARYELSTSLSVAAFTKALELKDEAARQLAADVISPYVNSLEERLKAAAPTFEILDKFVTTVNSLLRDKELSYRLTSGFAIKNSLGATLEPAQLSSGEQQLLLLFCYVLTARDTPSVFMIDEPEISLNVKWQRRLVKSLVDITAGASIQFIFASHSMELLAQHRDKVVKLENLND